MQLAAIIIQADLLTDNKETSMIRNVLIGVITALLFSTQVIAQQAFVEGVDYKLISPSVKTSNPDKVVVTELFWYGCPHCFRFEPIIQGWSQQLPDGVVFEQVPSIINPGWSEHARMFYALELMGVQDQVHKKIFDAIHRERKRLSGLDAISEFLAEQGIDEKKFRDTYVSFPVDSKMRKNGKRESGYGHSGVPSVVVNGKYLTSGSMAGSYGRLLNIVDYLAAKEQASR